MKIMRYPYLYMTWFKIDELFVSQRKPWKVLACTRFLNRKMFVYISTDSNLDKGIIRYLSQFKVYQLSIYIKVKKGWTEKNPQNHVDTL